MIGVWLFLAVPRVCLQFVIVVFPYHTHVLFWGIEESLVRYLPEALCCVLECITVLLSTVSVGAIGLMSIRNRSGVLRSTLITALLIRVLGLDLFF